MSTPFVLDHDLLCHGIKHYIPIDFDSHPHGLIVGSTGSGKSYALALLLGKISIHMPDARLVVADFKNSSFSRLSGQPGFYGYTNVLTGIDEVYREFMLRLELNDETRNRQKIFLVIDEYAALLGFLSPKDAEALKQRIFNMLAMGRSLGIHTIIGIQRADAYFFSHGAREQCSFILLLGNTSSEQKRMLVPDYQDQMNDLNTRGSGYLYLDGVGIRRVRVPRVNDSAALYDSIASKLWVAPTLEEKGDAGEA